MWMLPNRIQLGMRTGEHPLSGHFQGHAKGKLRCEAVDASGYVIQDGVRSHPHAGTEPGFQEAVEKLGTLDQTRAFRDYASGALTSEPNDGRSRQRVSSNSDPTLKIIIVTS